MSGVTPGDNIRDEEWEEYGKSEGLVWDMPFSSERRAFEAGWNARRVSPVTREDAITIPRPHVPHGPIGISENVADADYLREAAKHIEGGFKVGGSNLSATVIKMLRDSADALLSVSPHAEEIKPQRFDPEFRADLVEFAKDRIEAVWLDIPEGVDSLTLAQNIVSAQEFCWMSRQVPAVYPPAEIETEDMVERVARAIANAHVPTTGPTPPWDRENLAWKDTYRDFARAALQAVLAPVTPGEGKENA